MLDRVIVARFFCKEENNLPQFVVGPRPASGCGYCVEIKQLRERGSVARLSQASLQGGAERTISADDGNRGRLRLIAQKRLRATRGTAPNHSTRPGSRGGRRRTGGFETRYSEFAPPFVSRTHW